jgi:AraC family transcriptional regulator
MPAIQQSSSAGSAPSPATDSLGCQASKLYKDQEIHAGDMTFYRKRSDSVKFGHVATPASDRGFLVGISLSEGHRRRIFHGRQSAAHDFGKDSIYVRDFSEDYRADLSGGFDFLLFEMSNSVLARVGDEHGRARIRRLACTAGQGDPVLGHLAQALLPALERPAEANLLFVDQLGLTIGSYLIGQYGGASFDPARTRRQLSSLHEARAKDMLRSRSDGNITVSEIADACSLSRSHFIRAFRETTGYTPYQWLLMQRVERACELLRDSALSLAEIAIACDFCDQSHLTRVFSRVMAVSPGHWRRQARR